jgi:hypothetical protein
MGLNILLLRSNLSSCFNGIEVVAIVGTPSDPELGQAKVFGPCIHWLPQIHSGFGSMELINLCQCYGMLLNGRENKVKCATLEWIIVKDQEEDYYSY